jgi:predicted regulator of Ras-like GTPase activity (Roadblock/LC7/MglB family)
MTSAGEEAILTVITKPYANLEHLFSNIQHSVEKIKLLIN